MPATEAAAGAGPTPGMSFELTREVTPEMSARHLGSGSVGVLSTPSMIMMMEGASMQCVQPALAAGATTVGYIVNVRHLGPTAIGRMVRVTSRLEAVDGRKLRFRVEAHEDDRRIGDGEHVRVIIDSEAFMREASA